MSGNRTGISVYILGLEGKKYLAKTYRKKIGNARVTGYCIWFKAVKDVTSIHLKRRSEMGLQLKMKTAAARKLCLAIASSST